MLEGRAHAVCCEVERAEAHSCSRVLGGGVAKWQIQVVDGPFVCAQVRLYSVFTKLCEQCIGCASAVHPGGPWLW
jgi:hypothetical protein